MSFSPNTSLNRFSDAEFRKQRTAELSAGVLMDASLLEELARQNQELPPSRERQNNLARLSCPGTTVVITGQQVGLFLGPLFTLYKALSAIKTAQAIERESGFACVPLFWLQTEDHDFEEIRKTYFPDREGNTISLELPATTDKPHLPVHERYLASEVSQLHQTLRLHLGHLPHAEEMLSLCRSCYAPETRIGDAFAKMLAQLTSDWGLLFFNPRCQAAAKLAQPVFARAFEEHQRISSLLIEQTTRLKSAGCLPPVQIKDSSPLFFYHPPQASGERFRLYHKQGQLRADGFDLTLIESELASELGSHPDRFSSSALLRPIVQDTLFPNAAYIAGEAERQYHLQLEPLYPFFGLQPPLIVPRAHFLLIEAKVRKFLSELGLSSAELSLPHGELLQLVIERRSKAETSPQQYAAQIGRDLEQAFTPWRNAFEAIDATLVQSLDKTKTKMLSSLEALVTRHLNALATHDKVTNQRLGKLYQLLYPQQKEQERIFGPLYYLCRYGKSFLNHLLDAIEPFSGALKELDL